MLTKQFQDEAVRLTDNPRIPETVFPSPYAESKDRETVLPLVIRLLLNGWITDKEKVFLDSIAPEDCLTFLLNGRDYIHPEELDLFPFEEIEATVLHGGEAIFSHRYQPKHVNDSYQEYRIFSAVINPGESKRVILGFFGPSHRMGTIDEDCAFCRLVNTFRDAYKAIGKDLPALRQYMDRNQATVLISRSTGKVQALNAPASKLFSRADRALVDISLDQLKYHVAPLLPDYNLKMENVSVAELGISVVSLESNRGESGSSGKIMSVLGNQLSSCATSISMAGSRLGETTSVSEDPEKHRISQTVRQEAEKLRLASRQFSLIAEYENTEHTIQNIRAELETTLENVSGKQVLMTGECSDSATTQLNAAPDALSVMFESILSDHREYGKDPGGSKVVFEETGTSAVRIVFQTPVAGDVCTETIRSNNSVLAQHIAKLIGLDVTKNLHIEDKTLITELTIKK